MNAAATPPVIGELVRPSVQESRLVATTEAQLAPTPLVDEADYSQRDLQRLLRRIGPVPVAGIYDPPTDEERTLLYTAIDKCDNAAPRYARPYLMLQLLRLEEQLAIPDELRGVTLAAWCGESAYQLHEIVGDGGAAVGILQMHPHITRLCGPVELREDPLRSAHCWLWNLRRVQRKSAKRCGKRRSWKAAELWLSQGGHKSGYSCTLVSGHVARLERWQRAMRREQRLAARTPNR